MALYNAVTRHTYATTCEDVDGVLSSQSTPVWLIH